MTLRHHGDGDTVHVTLSGDLASDSSTCPRHLLGVALDNVDSGAGCGAAEFADLVHYARHAGRRVALRGERPIVLGDPRDEHEPTSS